MDLPTWIRNLGQDDLQFIKRFVLASGSLKAVAKEYGVSYPTMRGRLDKLITRIEAFGEEPIDPLHARLKEMIASGELSPKQAKELLSLHRESLGSRAEGASDGSLV